MIAGCTFIDDWGLYIHRRFDTRDAHSSMTDRGTYIHRRQTEERTFIDDRQRNVHSSTTDRGTYIHRRQRDGHASNDRWRTFIIDDSEKDIHWQTDRGRTFIDDSGTDVHRTTEDVRSSTDGGCTFIDDGRGSSGTQPSRDRRCGRCVGVGRERRRERESITRTRSAPISFAPISFASFAAAASSASKAHAQVSWSKIDMCSWILSSSSLSIHSLEPVLLHLFFPNCLQYVLPKRDLCFLPSCLHSFLVSTVAIVVCSPPYCR
jgi:hypothetical protein